MVPIAPVDTSGQYRCWSDISIQKRETLKLEEVVTRLFVFYRTSLYCEIL